MSQIAHVPRVTLGLGSHQLLGTHKNGRKPLYGAGTNHRLSVQDRNIILIVQIQDED